MYKQFYFVCLLLMITSSLTLKAGRYADTTICDKSCNTQFCCCNNDPTPAGVMISHVHRKGEWMLSYRYMSMDMKGTLSGKTAIDNNDIFVNYLMSSDKMHMDMHMLMGMYGITNKLTAMVMLNYNIVSMNMVMLDNGSVACNMPGMQSDGVNSTGRMKSAGLGDTKLSLLYALLNKRKHQLLISAGVSVPTGNVSMNGSSNSMYEGERMPYSMQMGSGTYDVLPAISYMYQWSDFTISTQVSSVVRTGYNSIGYKLGDELTSNTWLSYQWWSFFSTSLRGEYATSGAIKGYDSQLYYYNEPSSNPGNYGGQKATAYLGAVLQPKNGFLRNQRIAIEYGKPLYQNLNGVQMKLNQFVNASWTVMF